MLRHARCCAGHPRTSPSKRVGRLCIHPGERTERHPVYRGDERSCAASLRTSEWIGRRFYQEAFDQTSGLLRTSRNNSGCDPARAQLEALVAKMESKIDTGRQSRMERSIRDDHLRVPATVRAIKQGPGT